MYWRLLTRSPAILLVCRVLYSSTHIPVLFLFRLQTVLYLLGSSPELLCSPFLILLCVFYSVLGNYFTKREYQLFVLILRREKHNFCDRSDKA